MTDEQIECLKLAAKLSIFILRNKKAALTADECNLHELALAGLGFKDDDPQIPLEVIIKYVKELIDESMYFASQV